MARILSTALASLVLATTGAGTSQNAPAGLPPRLESYLTSAVRPTPAERKALMGGAPITKLLAVDESKEVAVFAAVWIDAPIRRYVESVKDIEAFERRGGIHLTKRISAPPNLEDFAQIHASDQDVEDLRTCRLGDCQVKLGAQAVERLRAEVDWKAPNAKAAVEALMRQLALEYVTGYLAGGDGRLAVYRDNSRPTFVAREFHEMVDQMPELTTDMPDVRRYLLGYPTVPLPASTSFLYWQEVAFGLKPTVRISHLTLREGPEDALVVSKLLYASHYFWTGLGLRVLITDPSRGPGFWFVTVDRSRSDGLSGFTGAFARRRVRSEVQVEALAELRATKRLLEESR